MNKTTVFSKTGKGLLEIKNKSNRLSKDQFRVLNLVDGKATLDDLVDKSRITEVELRKVLAGLSDGGFIKEFTNPAGSADYTSVTIPPVPPSTSYVDDLDFTQILGPAKSSKPGFYQSAQTEQRQREEAERKASEAAATKAREEGEKRAKEDAVRRAREEEAARRIREEAERKAKEEQARREKLEAEMRFRLDEPKRVKEEAERRTREKLEAEKRAKEEAERKVREEAERRAKIQAEAAARVEAERKRREDEERKRREDEERKRQEEEERKRREEEERKRREEEERKRREEEERRRREEEERKRREEEERKRRDEEERKRREEEERGRREEETRKRKEEEERKRREEEERRRKEEEERRRREEEEHRRKEEEERKRREQEEEERKRKEEEEGRRKEEAERLRRELEERHRREEQELIRRLEQGPLTEDEERKQREEEERQRQDEERKGREDERRQREEQERKRRDDEERARKREEENKRKEDEERKRRENEERKRREEERLDSSPFPSLDMAPLVAPAISTNLDSDLDALKRAEAEVEKEFMVKEEAIRKALEEQERRFRLEEEARAAMDRAEREAREKADQEGRELAEAAERARREAEQRSREEGIRRQQEERGKRAKEQEERKKKSEEERKKRERERREQDQRAREEALAKKRSDQEELDRKKSDRERLAREAKKRAWGPGRIAVVAGIVAVALLIVGIQVAPLSAYAPEMEKLASERIGEPVRIGALHASVFPSFHLKLDNVTIGQQQDVRVHNVTAYMDIGSMFGGEKLIKSLEIDELQATQDALVRLPGWLADDGTKAGKLKVRKIVLKGTKLDVRGTAMPAFNARLFLALDGTLVRAMIESVDGRFDAEILPNGPAADISARVKNFSLPLGPGFELTEGTVKGVLSSSQIRLTEMDLYLYGGQAKGQAVVSWGSPWSLEGEFEFKRVELEAAMKALKIDIVSDGLLDAKGRYALQAGSLDTLFENPRVESTFTVQKGSLSGFDFVRALQSPRRDGVQGGKTKFDELSGALTVAGARYTYSNARLTAGLLAASGACEILPNKDINGRAYVELRSTSNLVKNTFRITGSLKAIVLKP
jgi:hypothetical protein